MKRSDRQLDKGAIELIEEAVHLLRGAPWPFWHVITPVAYRSFSPRFTFGPI